MLDPVCTSSQDYKCGNFGVSLSAPHIIGDGQGYSCIGTDGLEPCHRAHKSAYAADVSGGMHEQLTTTKSKHRTVDQKVERVVVQHTCSPSSGREGDRRQENKMISVCVYPT